MREIIVKSLLISALLIGFTAQQMALALPGPGDGGFRDRTGINFGGGRIDGNDIRNTGLNGVGFGNTKSPGTGFGPTGTPQILIKKNAVERPEEPDIELPEEEQK